MVQPFRRCGTRWCYRQTFERPLHARQAHADQGEARAHRRVCGCWLSRTQRRQRCWLVVAWLARPSRTVASRWCHRGVHREVSRRVVGRARAAHPRRAHRSSMGRLGNGSRCCWRWCRWVDHSPTRRREPVERWQRSELGAAARGARGRSALRPTAKRTLPPRRSVSTLAPRPHRAELHL